MSDAIEAKLTSWSAKANREVRLGFVIQADDHDKVLHLSKMVGHDFGLALAKIDQQPAKEKAEIVTASEPEPHQARALPQRVGRFCADIRFRRWCWDRRYVRSPDEELVAIWVRAQTKVESRGEILPGTAAEQAWNLIEAAYLSENR